MVPAHAPLPRASLDSSKHRFVNAFLKSLKLRARIIDALFAQHATELALLERIYYINNNQHRPAIFWHRVVEARRYSRRLTSLDVPLLVAGLRKSFFHSDTTETKSSKPQKGAWTHYPPAVYLKSFCLRLRTCIVLLDKTYVRMHAIYHVLTLAIQNGAFLHLVVTLAAIIARLAHLSTSLRRALSSLHAECLHLFDKLYPTEATYSLRPLPPPPRLEGGDTEMPSFSAELAKRAVSDGDLDMSVDLGEVVAREPTPRSRPKSRSTSPMLPDFFSLVGDTTPIPPVGSRQPVATDHTSLGPSPPPITLEHSSRKAVIVKKRAAPPPSTPTATEEPKRKKHAKTKKIQRDEIEDIFS